MKSIQFEIRKRERSLNTTRAKAHYLSLTHIYPNSPNEYISNDSDILISNIQRYSLRALYFANNFIQKLKDILNRPLHENNSDEYVTSISDDIFFEFDAFIFSCKSIFEGNTIKKAKYLENESKKQFEQFSKKTYKNFIKPFLLPIRDEIVHLNNSGTASGSLIHIKKNDNLTNIKILTNFYNEKQERIDLIALFFFIFDHFVDTLCQLFGIFILHYFNKWGIPEKDICFNYNGKEKINLKDIPIPGFNGISHFPHQC